MIRWRREPREKGLAAVCQIHRGYDLWDDKEKVGYVRVYTNNFDRFKVCGYYFCISYKNNTLNSSWEDKVYQTEDEAKKEAVKLYKEWKCQEKQVSQ